MKSIGTLIICLALMISPAFAGQYGGVEEWYLYPSLQYFSWEEYNGGSRLLKEEGPLFGVGGGGRLDLYRKSLMLQVNGEMFGGDVHYRGQTQPDSNPAISERPLTTSVIYFGTKLESDIGWRMPLAAGSVEPFAGIGYRWWLRSLQNSTTLDTNGNSFAVGGSNEWWHIVYTKVGLRGNVTVTSDFKLFAGAEGRYPFLNRNIADFPGVGAVTVKPDPRWSLFAELGARYGRFRPSLFYEGLRLGQSPGVPIVVNGEHKTLFQPKSDSDIVGINFGWAF